MVESADWHIAECGQHMEVKDGAVARSGSCPVPAERGEPLFGELADRLFRKALVEPITTGKVGLNRRTEFGCVDLAFESFLMLATVDPVAHVVPHAAIYSPFLDARHTPQHSHECGIFVG